MMISTVNKLCRAGPDLYTLFPDQEGELGVVLPVVVSHTPFFNGLPTSDDSGVDRRRLSPSAWWSGPSPYLLVCTELAAPNSEPDEATRAIGVSILTGTVPRSWRIPKPIFRSIYDFTKIAGLHGKERAATGNPGVANVEIVSAGRKAPVVMARR